MTVVRLVADDLTGALDTAAEFVPLAGPIPVRSGDVRPAYASLAFDVGTREVSATMARAKAASAAPILAGADLAFVKVDSLLRGHPMTDLAVYWQRGSFDHCIVAPAFPHQGRITRGGVQFLRDGELGWSAVTDVKAMAEVAGLPVGTGDVFIADAESDADLAQIVEAGRRLPGRVLWCGSAGLAHALSCGQPSSVDPRLRPPFLGLFGSDQGATARQLGACGPLLLSLADASAAATRDVIGRLTSHGAALVSARLPKGLSRQAAARRIAGVFDDLIGTLPRPGTLIVSGGETLRSVCVALGADSLLCGGNLEPGVPVSTLQGGRWDGLTVVSKSGAFGRDGIWRDLLAAHGIEEKAVS